jgi:hypothetical protein
LVRQQLIHINGLDKFEDDHRASLVTKPKAIKIPIVRLRQSQTPTKNAMFRFKVGYSAPEGFTIKGFKSDLKFLTNSALVLDSKNSLD